MGGGGGEGTSTKWFTSKVLAEQTMAVDGGLGWGAGMASGTYI